MEYKAKVFQGTVTIQHNNHCLIIRDTRTTMIFPKRSLQEFIITISKYREYLLVSLINPKEKLYLKFPTDEMSKKNINDFETDLSTAFTAILGSA